MKHLKRAIYHKSRDVLWFLMTITWQTYIVTKSRILIRLSNRETDNIIARLCSMIYVC